MRLREILDIAPGKLILGINVISASNAAFFNMDGWSLDGIPTSIKNKRPDDTVRLIALTCLPNPAILKHEESLRKTLYSQEFTFDDLASNSRIIKKLLSDYEFEHVTEEQMVGMSLGESILSFAPKASDIYRADFYEVCCLHKVLFKQKVIWVRMTTNIRVNFHTKSMEHALNAPMEVL